MNEITNTDIDLIKNFFYKHYAGINNFLKKNEDYNYEKSSIVLVNNSALIEFTKSIIPSYIITKDGKHPIFREIQGDKNYFVRKFNELLNSYKHEIMYHEVFSVKTSAPIFGPVIYFENIGTKIQRPEFK